MENYHMGCLFCDTFSCSLKVKTVSNIENISNVLLNVHFIENFNTCHMFISIYLNNLINYCGMYNIYKIVHHYVYSDMNYTFIQYICFLNLKDWVLNIDPQNQSIASNVELY